MEAFSVTVQTRYSKFKRGSHRDFNNNGKERYPKIEFRFVKRKFPYHVFDLNSWVLYNNVVFIFLDKILTKYETVVLDSHDTLEDVINGILEDEEMNENESDDEMEETENENVTVHVQEDEISSK